MEDGYENENLIEYWVWERPLSSEKVARQLLELNQHLRVRSEIASDNVRDINTNQTNKPNEKK